MGPGRDQDYFRGHPDVFFLDVAVRAAADAAAVPEAPGLCCVAAPKALFQARSAIRIGKLINDENVCKPMRANPISPAICQ